jgi:putative ABC transport system ATP-binding protein
MHLLGCLDRPTVGEYWLTGRNVTELSDTELAHIRNHDIGFVFQGFNLLPRTSAVDNVELPMVYAEHIPGRERRKRATEALTTVGLGDRLFHQSNQMSGGQQQRVAIARALVNNPTILLADEPTGNLDSRTSLEIIEIVQCLNRERGLTIVLVTHEHDIAQYAGRLISFLDGSIRMDRPWHKAHRMPKRATPQQRLEWHITHAKACGCRKLTTSILRELRRLANSRKSRGLA